VTNKNTYLVRSAESGTTSKDTKATKGDTRLSSAGRFKTSSSGSRPHSVQHVSTAA
jgi:hypothetical protein